MLKLQFPSFENAFFLFLILAIIAYLTMPFLGYDNVVEQVIEKGIEIWAGEKIDFSPEFISKP